MIHQTIAKNHFYLFRYFTKLNNLILEFYFFLNTFKTIFDQITHDRVSYSKNYFFFYTIKYFLSHAFWLGLFNASEKP